MLVYWNLCVHVSVCPCVQVLSWRISSEPISLCLMFVYVRSDWFCRLTRLTEGWYICEKSWEMCICLWPEFDHPEVTLGGWQDIKIQLLLLLLNLLSWNLAWLYIIMGWSVRGENLGCCHEGQSQSGGLYQQDIAGSATISELMILLQANLAWWPVSTINPELVILLQANLAWWPVFTINSELMILLQANLAW